ncbi:MAG: flagellar hook capping FlgD N-terminal domain-containing protein [Candidatus Eisenbacteria bacterium]
MDISAINSVSATTSTSSSATAVMGKEDFLKLLVTQMTHQDPLNPIEDTEFVAQLAQFSTLEQMQNLNTGISDQAALLQSLGNSMAAALVGREVAIASDTLRLDNGESVTLGFQTAADVDQAVVTLYDAAGNRVDTLELAQLSAGTQRINWDGQNAEGETLPDGRYRFEVVALDSEGEALAVRPLVYGLVSGIAYENGTAFLTVEGSQVPLASLVEVLATTAAVGGDVTLKTED